MKVKLFVIVGFILVLNLFNNTLFAQAEQPQPRVLDNGVLDVTVPGYIYRNREARHPIEPSAKTDIFKPGFFLSFSAGFDALSYLKIAGIIFYGIVVLASDKDDNSSSNDDKDNSKIRFDPFTFNFSTSLEYKFSRYFGLSLTWDFFYFTQDQEKNFEGIICTYRINNFYASVMLAFEFSIDFITLHAGIAYNINLYSNLTIENDSFGIKEKYNINDYYKNFFSGVVGLQLKSNKTSSVVFKFEFRFGFINPRKDSFNYVISSDLKSDNLMYSILLTTGYRFSL